jgi:hypothetical protein
MKPYERTKISERVNMSNQSEYKKQQNLSFAQLLAETPNFVAVLASAILSRTILVFVDLLDSLGNVLRAAMVTILSKKLTKDSNSIHYTVTFDSTSRNDKWLNAYDSEAYSQK